MGLELAAGAAEPLPSDLTATRPAATSTTTAAAATGTSHAPQRARQARGRGRDRPGASAAGRDSGGTSRRPDASERRAARISSSIGLMIPPS